VAGAWIKSVTPGFIHEQKDVALVLVFSQEYGPQFLSRQRFLSRYLLEAGCLPSGIKVAASHPLLVGPAAERLGKLPIERMYVSDSVPTPEQFPVPIQVSSVASLLAAMIQRLQPRIDPRLGQPSVNLWDLLRKKSEEPLRFQKT
jgi:hypothetical protein